MNDLSLYRPCVGVMLMNQKGDVFAGQRVDNPQPAWQMPQGGIDPGETPRQAAVRELEEETGVPADAVKYIAQTQDWLTYDLPPELAARLWKGKYRGQRQLWFLYRLTGPETLINIETKHPEFREWAWKRPVDMPDLIVPFKRPLYQKVLAAFSKYFTDM